MILQRTPQAVVSLERLSTKGTTARFSGPLKSFHATHPSVLPHETIARVLSGILVKQSSEDARAQPIPLLSGEEVAFLTPPISTAFAQRARTSACGFTSAPPARSAGPRCSSIALFFISR